MKQFWKAGLIVPPKNVFYCILTEKVISLKSKIQKNTMFTQLQPFGKILIFVGLFIVILGILFLFADKIPFLGKLPGDIYIKKKNFTIYIPLATSILLSIIISLILYLLRK